MKSMRKHILILIAVGAFAFAVCWFSRPSERVISAGVGEARVSLSGVAYRFVRVDLRRARIDLKWRDGDGQRHGTLAAAMKSAGEHAIFAANVGIFDKSFTPLGLHIENGRELHPLNLEAGVGNFFWKPNAVFGIRSGKAFLVRSESFKADASVDLATQSGPMLIENGTVLPNVAASTASERTRSGVGITVAGEVIFILSLQPCSFAAFAKAFVDVDCSDAMYLDGEISRFRARGDDDDGDFAAILVLSSR